MALLINTEELMTGKTVEWERVEFKKGWNPLASVQSISAFANDMNNWGGGYLIIGVEEKDGRPIRPVTGLKLNQLDKIQKELVEVCHRMRPQYFPIIEPVEIDGRMILVVWAPGGESRPYKAPDSQTKNPTYSYYIRRGSVTKKANDQEQRDLMQMSAHIPYDDRVNQHSNLTDIKLSLVRQHLQTIGSGLLDEIDKISPMDLYRKMNIVTGPDEYVRPKNIGLMLFNDDPTNYFPCAQIDLLQFRDESGDSFTEKIFKGPVQQQLGDALLFIKNNIIAERVVKISGQAEASRSFNYPYDALEEAIVNTVYHRSYEDDSPIEIRVYPSRIELVSYPGPLPPLNKEKLLSGKIVARKYRNRRIGDFLKELHLTEGRGTGIPKIIKAMKRNGSPAPVFETDDDLSYFTTTLPVHSLWLDSVRDNDGDNERDNDKDNDSVSIEALLLKFCLRPKKRREIMTELNVYNNSTNYQKYVKPLIEAKFIRLTIPDKLQSTKQQYQTTPLGEEHLKNLLLVA